MPVVAGQVSNSIPKNASGYWAMEFLMIEIKKLKDKTAYLKEP